MDKEDNTHKRDICERTFNFGIKIIKLSKLIPKNVEGMIVVKQFIRSGTSIGANVEEAQDGLTKKEFIKSMSIALKEARETKFWLRIAVGADIIKLKYISNLLTENDELIKILTTIVKKSKSNI